MRITEAAGLGMGYIIGVLTGTMSFVRQSRVFHPQGLLFEAKVDSKKLSSHALARFSTAWWKHKEWPDVLGVAFRFTHNPPTGVKAHPGDQDVLFATIRYPATTPAAPFLTQFHDFSENIFYAVSPFRVNKKIARLRLVPCFKSDLGKSRNEKLLHAVEEKKAKFEIQYRERGRSKWSKLAKIDLIRPLELDHEALRFDPFLNDQDIVPIGFVHYLRKGAYRLSQLARPKSSSL